MIFERNSVAIVGFSLVCALLPQISPEFRGMIPAGYLIFFGDSDSVNSGTGLRMTSLKAWGRISATASLVVFGVAIAQAQTPLKPWPTQQPQQAQPQQRAWPGDAPSVSSGAAQPMAMQPPPMNASPPPGMGMGAPGGGMGAPGGGMNPAREKCMTEFSKLRGNVENAGKTAKAINDRKGTREDFCKAITNLSGAQTKWVKYTTEHATSCGIPPDVVSQLKAGATHLAKLKTNVCSGGGAAAGAPAAPSLSEALGTATMPTTDDAPRRRGGTLDTLTGATIR